MVSTVQSSEPARSETAVLQAVYWYYANAREVTGWLALLSAVYLVLEVLSHWGDWANVNLLVITGFAVAVFLLLGTQDLRREFESLVDKVFMEGVVYFREMAKDGPDDPETISRWRRKLSRRERARQDSLVAGVKQDLNRRTARWGLWTGALLLPMGLIWLLGLDHGGSDRLANLAYAMAAIIVPLFCITAGLRLGQIACYGWRGTRYRSYAYESNHIGLSPVLGHHDGHCGLAPIGKFYLLLVTKVVWPVIYLVVWISVLGLGFEPAYLDASGPVIDGFDGRDFILVAMTGALALILFLQVLGFLAPLSSIHKELKKLKSHYIKTLHEESERLALLQERIEGAEGAERADLISQAAYHRERCRDIWNMPEWPASSRMFRRFWLNQAVSVTVPVCFNAWDTGLLDWLAGLEF